MASESHTALAGSIEPMETWIDRVRYRVAAELGVDPDTLQMEVIQVGQEVGGQYVDIRFKSL